jgi:hypothetical protein
MALELDDLAARYGRRPSELLENLETLAVDLTIRRTARAALRLELKGAAPAGDDLGMGRIIMLLQLIAER